MSIQGLTDINGPRLCTVCGDKSVCSQYEACTDCAAEIREEGQ